MDAHLVESQRPGPGPGPITRASASSNELIRPSAPSNLHPHACHHPGTIVGITVVRAHPASRIPLPINLSTHAGDEINGGAEQQALLLSRDRHRSYEEYMDLHHHEDEYLSFHRTGGRG